jgi:hypothetical protein
MPLIKAVAVEGVMAANAGGEWYSSGLDVHAGGVRAAPSAVLRCGECEREREWERERGAPLLEEAGERGSRENTGEQGGPLLRTEEAVLTVGEATVLATPDGEESGANAGDAERGGGSGAASVAANASCDSIALRMRSMSCRTMPWSGLIQSVLARLCRSLRLRRWPSSPVPETEWSVSWRISSLTR